MLINSPPLVPAVRTKVNFLTEYSLNLLMRSLLYDIFEQANLTSIMLQNLEL